MPPTKDHPRIRGVHPESSTVKLPELGSSPHTRGPPESGWQEVYRARIIPAYAGSTLVTCRGSNAIYNHPRIRGVHSSTGALFLSGIGSSPHTRGPLCVCVKTNCCSRIIPAYAGSTISSYSHASPVQDHPRIRGVHSFLLNKI